MNYTIPHYYRQFHCIADRCQDTCCAGWEIMIDPASMKKYREEDGPLGNRLHNSIRWSQHSFKQYEGRCTFLNDENLCDLYAEGGQDMLCKTCRSYPRHVEEFDGSREISLCLSCIEAAGIILGCREKVRFLSYEKEGKEDDYQEFDFFLYTKLMDARDLALKILQNRDMDLPVRISMALALAHDLQSRIDRERLFAVDGLLERYGAETAAGRFCRKVAGLGLRPEKRYRAAESMFGVFDQMEVLKENWPAYLEGVRKALYGRGAARYAEEYHQFLRHVACGAEDSDWQLWGEQLMVYFVFTYFCGAVYDGRAFARMKLAAVSTLLIQETAFGLWQEKGELSFEDFVDAAHRYSREIEHSDDNREALLHELDTGAKYQLERLLGLILSPCIHNG